MHNHSLKSKKEEMIDLILVEGCLLIFKIEMVVVVLLRVGNGFDSRIRKNNHLSLAKKKYIFGDENVYYFAK